VKHLQFLRTKYISTKQKITTAIAVSALFLTLKKQQNKRKITTAIAVSA
jgi:hypothetical protein